MQMQARGSRMRPYWGSLHHHVQRANRASYPLDVYGIGYAQRFIYVHEPCTARHCTLKWVQLYAHSHLDVALGYRVLSPIESLPLHDVAGCSFFCLDDRSQVVILNFSSIGRFQHASHC